MQSQNLNKVLLQLLPQGIEWYDNKESKEILEACAKELTNAYLYGLETIKSTPSKGTFKKNWDKILNGIFLKHKGIIDLDTDISITNTILFFQKIINSFGLENQIKIKITLEKKFYLSER